MSRGRVWGYGESDDDFLTTKFLELLVENNYEWSRNLPIYFVLNLGKKEKERLLSAFNESLINIRDQITEGEAAVGLSDIKDMYVEECKRLFAASQKNDESILPWFSLAHQLFEERGGRDISIQEFKRNELACLYNHLIEVDLLVISNRNLHLKTLRNEFLTFTSFVNRVSNKKHLLDFLIPVFQHLYLLARSHNGKSIADKFIRLSVHVPSLPQSVVRDLTNCESFEELQLLVNRSARIRVKLPSNAYRTLVKWLQDSFSATSQMFNILRVLHENFHIDVYEDKDDKEFSSLEEDLTPVLDKKAEALAKKKSKSGVSVKTCKTPQNDEDRLSLKMSELQIKAEAPKMPATPSTSEIIDRLSQKMSEVEIKAETPKISETPSTSESTGKNDEKIDLPADSGPILDKNTGKEDEKTDLPEDSGPILDKNTGKEDEKTDLSEDSGPILDKNTASGSSSEHKIPVFKIGRDSKDNFKLKASDFKLRDSARRYLDKVKQSGMSVEEIIEEVLQNHPNIPDHSAVSSASEYVTVSEASIEKDDDDDTRDGIEDQDLNDGKDDTCTQDTTVAGNNDGTVQQNIEPPDQNMSVAGNNDGSLQQNIEPMNQNISVAGNNDGTLQQNIEPMDQNISVAGNNDGTVQQIPMDQNISGAGNNDGTVQQNTEPMDQNISAAGNNDGTVQQNIEPPDQNMSVAGNDAGSEQQNLEPPHQDTSNVAGTDAGAEQQNLEPQHQDTSNDTTEGARNEEHQSGTKYHYNRFKQSYKTNFHSVVPITISGKDIVCSSDISPDLRYMACGFESCKIATWRLLKPTGFSLQPLGTLRGHTRIVYSVSIDSNKKVVISGSHDHTVRIWDIEISTCLKTLSAHKSPVYSVCISPNSKYFLSASEDRNVVLYWYGDEYPLRVFVGHSMKPINCVRFHPNCAYFACACSDGNLFMFKINDDTCPVRMFHKHKAEVYTLSFSPCGKNLASADIEGMIVIWDILTYSPIKIHETCKEIRSISYDNSGTFLAVLFYDQSWGIYNLEESMREVIAAKSHGMPNSVHFTKGNKMFIVQYIYADKKEIEEAKDKPKTEITGVL